MSTLTKFALGVMGQLRPRPARGDAKSVIKLPAPDKTGGLPLMQALGKRRSSREFLRKPLPLPVLSSLLWAAFGVNRRGGGRTAPSALDAQEIEAPLDLVLVADHTRMRMVPAAQRESYASAAAGAIADALGLTHDQQVLLSQTVGYPAKSRG